MKYVIIGNGAAGISAAQSIRKSDEDGEIVMISRSEHAHYYRPGLIEYLRGEKPLDKLIIFESDYYEKNRINNILKREIVSINDKDQFILDKDGDRYDYDRLLLAAGGVPWLPPVGGADATGVFTLRGIGDADSIIDYCREKVVVVGGGLLGLETAGSLSAMGKDVTVIEFASCLLPRQLDPHGAKVLKDILSERGIHFLLDESVKKINSENGAVNSIELNSGSIIDADTVIISAGIRPDASLAVNFNLETNRGVVVNSHLETSMQNVYAAGDVAEHNGMVYGLWTAAMDQGRIAGMNMTGERSEYNGTVPSTMLKVSGVNLYSSGDVTDTAAEILVSMEGNNYAKYLFKKDSPLGSVVIGDMDAISMARKFMSGKAGVEDVRQFIENRNMMAVKP